jgi:hypothetical protein
MIAIHSFFKNTSDIRSDTGLTSRQASLSCKFLKKHNFTTILYTDYYSIEYFKHIPYDDIIILDIPSIKPNIPKDCWSVSKLISGSVTNEPYFHIDTDLFLIENHIQNFADSKFFLLHAEPWYKYTNLIPKINDLFDYISYDSLSYNNAIFGGQNYVDMNKNIINLIDTVIENYANIENILALITLDAAKTIFVEQYLFNNLIKRELNIIEIPLIIKESMTAKGVSGVNKLLEQSGMIHLWYRKSFIEETIGINNYLDSLEKKYF